MLGTPDEEKDDRGDDCNGDWPCDDENENDDLCLDNNAGNCHMTEEIFPVHKYSLCTNIKYA